MSQHKRKRSKNKKMNCNVFCPYFPDMTCNRYVYDENGVKKRADGKKFICAFDGHEIKSWYDNCPLKENKE